MEEVGKHFKFNWGRHTSAEATLMVHVHPTLNVFKWGDKKANGVQLSMSYQKNLYAKVLG